MNKTGKVNQSSRAPIKKGFGDRAIRFKCSMQNTILDVLRSKGWVEVKEDDTDFDLFWADRGWMREYFDQCFMEDHVRINHFRNHYELTRKNLMVKNLKRYKKNLDREVGKLEAAKCDFFPTTFELPSEYHMFVDEFKRNPGSVWIMKPVAKSQGKGIFLFRKLKDITEWKKSDIYRPREEKIDEKEPPETYIVSKYIERPYVIGGRKFDLRVYVLVTSLLRITSTHNALVTFCKRLRSLVQDPSMMYTLQQQQHIGSRKQYVPLKAWLYREGFARFSNTRFSLESIDDAYVHLTNVAVQKTAPDYDPDKGCKWSLRQVRQYLTAKHGLEPVEELVRQMNAVFINSLLSVQKIMINDKHCFELYGYDILIDANLKPCNVDVPWGAYFESNSCLLDKCPHHTPNYKDAGRWLIEVNASPSLTASGPEDYTLKLGLLEDVLHIVDMENRLTGKEKRVGGFDLMWDDGPVFAEEGGLDCINPPSYSTNTYLGCYNDRKKQLRNLCKQLMAQKKTGS